jgi:hypothetical protein
MLGKTDDAIQCSRTAIRIYEKYDAKEWQSRLGVSVYGFCFPLKRPLRESLDPLLEGHRAGLVSGDLMASQV